MNQIKKVILSILIAVFVLGFVIHIGPQNGVIGDYIDEDKENLEISSYLTYELPEGSSFEQTFVPETSYISEIKMVMLQVGDDCTGTLHYSLLDEQGNEFMNRKKDIESLKPGEWNVLKVESKVQEGKKTTLKITAEGVSQTPVLMMMNSAFDTDENQEAYIDGNMIPGGTIIMYYYKQTYSMLFRILVCTVLILAGILALFFIHVEQPVKTLQKILMKDGDIKKNIYYIAMVFLAGWIMFLHLFKLQQVPFGLHIDEMGMGYDAYCIANWGVDRFTMSFPVYFINIGTGQNALYTYMAAICIKLFGYSEAILRVPAVINACLTVICGAGIVWKKWKTRKSVILFTGLYSILPFFLMSTRFGLESLLMLGFATLFLFMLMHAVEQKKTGYYIIAGICGGILLYTYAISYLVMIVFLILGLWYLLRVKKISLKQITAFAIPLGIIAMPLILCQIINMFDLPEIKIGLLTITKLQGYRGSEVAFNHIFANLVANIKNIFWHDYLLYNSYPEYMTMFWVSIPFILIGISHAVGESIHHIKEKDWDITVVMTLWFFCMLAMGCLLGGTGPNCNKVNGIYISCIFFLVDGILCMIDLMKQQVWAKGVLLITTVSYLVCFISFADYYYYRSVQDNYPMDLFETTYADAINTLNAQGDVISQRTTYIEETSAIYYCGSTLVSPYEFDYYNDTEEYQQYRFQSSVTHLEDEANYILRDANKSFAIELENNGYIVQKLGAWFVCYKAI